jgi:hypothetical protein
MEAKRQAGEEAGIERVERRKHGSSLQELEEGK